MAAGGDAHRKGVVKKVTLLEVVDGAWGFTGLNVAGCQ
jgi:hypothetical protein